MPLSKVDDAAKLLMKKEDNTWAPLGRETGNSQSKGHGYKGDRSGDLSAIDFKNSINLPLYVVNVQGMTFILIYFFGGWPLYLSYERDSTLYKIINTFLGTAP